MTKKKSTRHIHPTIMKYVNSPEIATEYDKYFKESQLFHYDCEFIHDQLTPPAKILDLGCGTARHLLFLESLGFTTYGIDLSWNFLQESQKKLKSYGYSDKKLIQADIMHLPLNECIKFEGILLMFSVLGLIQGSDNRVQLLNSLRHNLSATGKVIVHVHNYDFKYSVLVRRLKEFKKNFQHSDLLERGDKIVKNYRNIQDIYIHSFTLAEITQLFTMSGYKICELVGLNATRSGKCYTKNIQENANGFLISAQKTTTQ